MAKDDEKAPNAKTRSTDQRGARPGLTTMPQPHGGSIGQKPYVPTDRDREFVAKSGFFLGQDRTAERLGISVDTLTRHYRKELDHGEDEFLLAGGKVLARQALEGDGAQLRFLLARRFPKVYGEKKAVEHSGEIGTPRTVDLSAFLEGKTEDECRAIIAGIDALAAAGGIDLPGVVGGDEEGD